MYGLADQGGLENIQHVRTGAEWKVAPAWSMASRYSDYWLADAHDALYNTASAVVARSANGSAGRWVGQEIDFESRYQPFKTSQVGAGLAHIFPGTFLKLTTTGRGYTPPMFFSTASSRRLLLKAPLAYARGSVSGASSITVSEPRP
jgi:hypothetical protein